ncbi:MAG: glycoside hydrolase family 13 protein [Chloroflexi bacterium]|nr:glycoside hydrolase family 13 protein [Chloroflexota bacterium]
MSAITPDWVHDAIIYEIFPDRFASNSQVEKPDNLEPWDTPPTAFGFKGGDLLGVVERLDYLQHLGVNTLYFTPVFQSTANHRYHTHDYFQIDPILGGNAAFQTLLDAAHARGLRVILDGVFNHASRGFYQFNHALENGARSPYREWFNFHGFPVKAYEGASNYDAWWGIPALPKFNHRNTQVREFIFRVAEHWTRAGIDGWRLDVPSEIDDDEFWREFRRRVKAINSQAYIVGEIWQRADRWLQGDQFDAVMNYQFTRAAIGFFADLDHTTRGLIYGHTYGDVPAMDADAFARALADQLTWYPEDITFAQMNLLNSHDTARFATLLRGDLGLFKLALLTLFAFVGAPMLYYGDEIALEGGKDPDNRRGMIWDPARVNRELIEWTRRLALARTNHPALRRGSFHVLYAEGKVIVFARHREGDCALIAINASREPVTLDVRVAPFAPNDTRLIEEWSREEIVVQDGYARGIHLPARTGALFAS